MDEFHHRAAGPAAVIHGAGIPAMTAGYTLTATSAGTNSLCETAAVNR